MRKSYWSTVKFTGKNSKYHCTFIIYITCFTMYTYIAKHKTPNATI